MYHHGSTGSISYAEFRKLGKPGVLGRYNLHYHLCSDSMRGSSIIGASFWDSGNRWLTVHGTNYLVVRDCVGYQSLGHGFFLEDGTEVFNVFDRNLAVQAYNTKPLPKQIIPFDKNDGSGFWWANCHNSFTRNGGAEWGFNVTRDGCAIAVTLSRFGDTGIDTATSADPATGAQQTQLAQTQISAPPPANSSAPTSTSTLGAITVTTATGVYFLKNPQVVIPAQ